MSESPAKPANSKRTVELTDDRGAVRIIVQDSVGKKARAVVTDPSNNKGYRGAFSECTRDALALELQPDEGLPPLAVLATVCLYVKRGDRTFGLVTRVLSHKDNKLELEMPRRILGNESRIAIRVPVGKDSGFASALVVGEKRVPVEAVDLTLSGIFIRHAPSYSVSTGDRLVLELSLEGHRVTIEGVVVRQTPDGFGISFPSVFRDGDLLPPRELQQIVRTLEQKWRHVRG